MATMSSFSNMLNQKPVGPTPMQAPQIQAPRIQVPGGPTAPSVGIKKPRSAKQEAFLHNRSSYSGMIK